ncbi:hypothetical protein JCM14469_20760 [Desulfatiferula olefinivorans]
MALNFKINTQRKDKGRIEIHMSGDFDGMSAWELIHKMTEYSGTCDLIEVNTNGLRELVPFGRKVFTTNAAPLSKSPSRYVITGPMASFFSESGPFGPMRV